MAGSSKEALKGGYIISDCVGVPEVILIASGSEVELVVKAKEQLEQECKKIRVVSMPCMDLFEEQTEEYKEAVLPKSVRKRVAILSTLDLLWNMWLRRCGGCSWIIINKDLIITEGMVPIKVGNQTFCCILSDNQ